MAILTVLLEAGSSRTFSLPNVLPFMYFWLILSPDCASELMIVLCWCCPAHLKPTFTLCSILLAAGETGSGLAYKNKEFASSSSHKIPSPQHILPGRFCIPGIPQLSRHNLEPMAYIWVELTELSIVPIPDGETKTCRLKSLAQCLKGNSL